MRVCSPFLILLPLWFANIINYLVAYFFPSLASKAQTNKMKSDAKYYIWDDPYLWKLYSDQVIRRCIPDHEIKSIHNFVTLPHLVVTFALKGPLAFITHV